MFRFLFRLAASVALAIAVIMAVLDVTRTIAASQLVMTPLDVAWTGTSPETFAAARTFLVETIHPLAWDPVSVFILGLPGFAVFAVLALVLYAVGRPPKRRPGLLATQR